MTEDKSLLLVLAQIFMAFAGFVGVVAAFSTIRPSPHATVFRVRALAAVALFGLLASLVPFLPEAFGASTTARWRG